MPVQSRMPKEARILFKMAQRVLYMAAEKPNRRLLKRVQRFITGMTLIHDLWLGFQQANGKIEGDTGMAKKHLHISANGVYLFLRWLKLKPQDFRDEKKDWGVLVVRSRTLAPLLEELMDLDKSLPQRRKRLAKKRRQRV